MQSDLLPIRIGAFPIQRDIVNQMQPAPDFESRWRRVPGETLLRRIGRGLPEHHDRWSKCRAIRGFRQAYRLQLRRLTTWASAKRAEIDEDAVIPNDRAGFPDQNTVPIAGFAGPS